MLDYDYVGFVFLGHTVFQPSWSQMCTFYRVLMTMHTGTSLPRIQLLQSNVGIYLAGCICFMSATAQFVYLVAHRAS